MAHWEDMLADLNASRQRAREVQQEKTKTVEAVGLKLDRLFNAKAAHRLFPSITEKRRMQLVEARIDATEFSDKVASSIMRGKYNHTQIGMLWGIARASLGSKVGPHLKTTLDPQMTGTAYALLNVLRTAFDVSTEAYNLSYEEEGKAIYEREKAVFYQFLSEEPKAAVIMRKLASQPVFNWVTAKYLSDESVKITEEDMNTLKAQIDDILTDSNHLNNIHSYTQEMPAKDGAPAEIVCMYHLEGICAQLTRNFFKVPDAMPEHLIPEL